MKQMFKQTSIAVAAACIIAACGSKEKKGGDAETPKQAPVAAVAMKPLDLTANGIPITIQAPEGAQVTKEKGGSDVVVAKDRFNILIREDKFGEENATAEQTKETALKEDSQTLNDPGMGMKMEVLTNDPTGYLFMTTNKQGGKICRFTYVINKDGKNYIFRENFMELNDIERSMNTGYSISREEAETMYKAVKQ